LSKRFKIACGVPVGAGSAQGGGRAGPSYVCLKRDAAPGVVRAASCRSWIKRPASVKGYVRTCKTLVCASQSPYGQIDHHLCLHGMWRGKRPLGRPVPALPGLEHAPGVPGQEGFPGRRSEERRVGKEWKAGGGG